MARQAAPAGEEVGQVEAKTDMEPAREIEMKAGAEGAQVSSSDSPGEGGAGRKRVTAEESAGKETVSDDGVE